MSIPGLLDKDLPAPLYHQLQCVLEAEIESARWHWNERLPSEGELAKRFGVSKITVRQALQGLAQLGYIRREQGRGTFVARRKFDEGPRELTSFTEEMRRHGLAPSSRVLTQSVMEAAAKVSDALKLPRGAQVLVVRRLRLADKEPLGIQTTHIPATFVPGLELTENMSLYEALQTQFHLYPARARETYFAALADGAAATLLGIAAGSPVFRVERVTFLPNDKPLEFVQSTVRGDRYSIVLDLVKNSGERQALTLKDRVLPSPQVPYDNV